MSEAATPRRRRPFGLAVLLAAAIAAALYLRCGSGWGLGGSGGTGTGSATGHAAVPQRCALKVTAAGLVVDGTPATRDAAVATCKAAGGAIVTVVGDAREGDWTELEQALEAAHVPFDRRGP